MITISLSVLNAFPNVLYDNNHQHISLLASEPRATAPVTATDDNKITMLMFCNWEIFLTMV